VSEIFSIVCSIYIMFTFAKIINNGGSEEGSPCPELVESEIQKFIGLKSILPPWPLCTREFKVNF
jgi:hypothetical protein